MNFTRNLGLACACIGAIYTAAAHADVVAYWQFEGTSTVRNDSSGNNWTLAQTSLSSIGASAASDIAPGMPGSQSVDFTNSTRSFSVGAIDLTANTALTVEFYAKLTSPTGSGSILQHGDPVFGGSGTFGILASGGDLVITHSFRDASNKNGAYRLTTDGIDMNVWHHYAVVIDNTLADPAQHLSLYVDGQLYSTTSTQYVNAVRPGTGSPRFASGFVFLGNNRVDAATGNNPFQGEIDEVRIATGVLSPGDFLPAVSVPEPASAGFIAASGLALLWRRRK